MATVNELGVFITRPAIGSQWESPEGEIMTITAICGHFVIMEGCKRISAAFLVHNYKEVES